MGIPSLILPPSHPRCSKYTFPVEMHPSLRIRVLLVSALGRILHNAQYSKGQRCARQCLNVSKCFLAKKDGVEMLWMLKYGLPRDAMVAESSKLFPVPIRRPVMLTYLAFLLAFFFNQESMKSSTLAVSIITNT